MSRPQAIVLSLCLSIFAYANASAESFTQRALLPSQGITTLDRSVSRNALDRDLMGATYSGVVIGNVDVYDRFPYLEAHYFQVLSDPQWNRIVFGEADRGLSAFDGKGTAFGELSRPHGMATDAQGRLYVADSGNDRVLVFQSSSEFDALTLIPLYSIDGLSNPFDVAVSDAGTPLDFSDDIAYVANSGANEVVRFSLQDDGATLTHRLGELGGGERHFAGPMAITVGRDSGHNTDEIYVADAHSGQMIRLHDNGTSFDWMGGLPHELGLVTSLDADHWGNVYAAAPNSGVVQKFTPSLLPLAAMSNGLDRPRSFHIPMIRVHDHVQATESISGHGAGILVEQWGEGHGVRLMELGVDLSDVNVSPGDALEADFLLSDHARVSAEIIDPTNGHVIARHDAGMLASGRQSIRFADADFAEDVAAGRYDMRIAANSSYEHGATATQTSEFQLASDRTAAVANRILLGAASPNPFNPSTEIEFSIPVGIAQSYRLAIYDGRGRLIRELASGSAGAGNYRVRWDGSDDRGQSVGSGIYLYRLTVGEAQLSDKMVLVK